MTLDELSRTTGEWLRGTGTMSDVVISSRIRLARNLADYPFLSTASSTQRTEIYRRVADAITSAPCDNDALMVNIEEMDPIDRELLVERHLVSRQHAAAEGCRGVSISKDETRSVMINEEDHLRIQTMRSGLELEGLWEASSALDDALSRELAFAFDREYGYLTACPTNVGTGIRVSVMLHLPAVRLTKEIERLAQAARDMRLAVRGVQGEGTDALGDLYQVSNQTTLGVSEAQIIEMFSKTIIPKMVEYERLARDKLVRDSAHELDDRIWRAYGVLSNARRIASDETQGLLSPIRIGVHLERFDLLDIATLNELFLQTQPAHLQKLHGSSLDGEQRDVVRADYLRRRLLAKHG
ncbi:MAG: protein arginine kinase [Phycisphaerae bacterium]|jgi:protein arginine kinase